MDVGFVQLEGNRNERQPQERVAAGQPDEVRREETGPENVESAEHEVVGRREEQGHGWGVRERANLT